MNISALINEIKTDPLNRGYANMTNQQLFDSLHVINRPKILPLSSNQLLAWAAQNGRYSKILSGTTVTLANSTLTNSCRSICWAALKIVERDNAELDLNLPDRASLVAALVTFNILTQSDIDNLYSSATMQISRLEELNCQSIIFEHFSFLRDTNR
jgi:hypothetical protein